jgi:hypothetical protein
MRVRDYIPGRNQVCVSSYWDNKSVYLLVQEDDAGSFKEASILLTKEEALEMIKLIKRAIKDVDTI